MNENERITYRHIQSVFIEVLNVPTEVLIEQ